jgi:multidrug resistance protein MdtO
MALLAVEAQPGFGRWLMRQLAPASGRWEFAAKLAAVCAITTGAAVLYRTPEPAVAAYLAFFVSARDRATSLVMGLLLPLLVAIILLIVFVTAMFTLDHPAWRVAAMAALSSGFLFLASASKLKPLAATFGLIVGYGLDKLGGVQLGEEATRGLLYAWLFVAMPAAASIVFNLVLGFRPRRMATRELARRLELAAAMLEAPTEARRRALAAALTDGGGEIRHWLKLGHKALGARSADLTHLDQATSSTLEILAAVAVLSGESPPPPAVCAPITTTLRDMAAILHQDGYPVEIAPASAPWPDAPGLGAEALAALRRAVIGFAVLPSAPTGAAEASGGGFFVEDAFTNPAHLQFAFKITAAAMGCYLIYSILHWPGIHTCFLTCYIVGLGTVAESIEKLALRLGGAAIGAVFGLAALLFVMPHVVSVGGLLLVVALGALACGYVAAGSPRIAYVGFQMTFAFLLCTVQGAAPGFDMKTIRDRVIGIAIGNIAVYVISTRIWPTSVAARVDHAFANTLRALGRALRGSPHALRPQLASAVYVQAEAIEADLTLARYEPAPIRAPAAWLRARTAGLEALVDLQTASLVASDIGSSIQLSQRLDALAQRLETAPPLGDPTRLAPPPAQSVTGLVDQTLGRLEAALSNPGKEPAHAPD